MVSLRREEGKRVRWDLDSQFLDFFFFVLDSPGSMTPAIPTVTHFLFSSIVFFFFFFCGFHGSLPHLHCFFVLVMAASWVSLSLILLSLSRPLHSISTLALGTTCQSLFPISLEHFQR